MTDFRTAEPRDVPAMARLRAATWGTEDYWRERIAAYMDGRHSPHLALDARAVHVAVSDGVVIGLIAGHRTQRFGCDGELEWVDVAAAARGSGVADELMRLLARWFVERRLSRVCVDVHAENVRARRFYTRHGARDLSPHWMVWDDVGVVLKQQ